ncbi:MAG TPA: DUF6265 family protein [Flavobacterium sp.]|jgi:hypothetical protein
MINKKLILAVLLVGGLFMSCKKEDTKTEETAEKQAPLQKAEWLLGRWENNSKAGNLSEIWIKANDSVYHGEAYFVVGIDTVFAETVELAASANKLTYTVSVPGQNEEKPVAFSSTKVDAGQMVFENPNHEYPSKIMYRFVKPDSLIAEIWGTKKGAPKSEKFLLKKVK